jgi:hypothetical protein
MPPQFESDVLLRVALKRGSKEPADHALGLSRGVFTTKIHLVCDRHGWPLTFTLSLGQQADSRHFISILERIHLPGRTGRPRKRSCYIVGGIKTMTAMNHATIVTDTV